MYKEIMNYQITGIHYDWRSGEIFSITTTDKDKRRITTTAEELEKIINETEDKKEENGARTLLEKARESVQLLTSK